MMESKIGLYIHIPFCNKKCGYCDFYSLGYNESVASSYIDAVIKECQHVVNKYQFVFDTIYIGGGTPSVLPVSLLEKLVSGIFRYAQCSVKEFTIEINPCTSQNIHVYKDLGINRVSIGIQSMDNDILRLIGREHDSNMAKSALERAVKNYDNVSADMIIGLPSQTMDSIEKTISTLSDYASHISMYILKLSENTAMSKVVESGKYLLPDDDTCADMYDFSYDLLKKHGYKRYEISNFARDNMYSYHNMKYWQRDDYIGLGAAAHSFINGTRYDNPADINKYIAGENLGENKANITTLSYSDQLFEEIMLGFRLSEGINIKAINKKYNIDFLTRYKRQLSALKDIVENGNSHIRLKDDKMLLESAVAKMFL